MTTAPMSSTDALIIFYKNPVPGHTKTLLAAGIGDSTALKIYMRLLEHTRTVAKNTRADKFVFYLDAIPEHDLWADAGFTRLPQHGSNMGEQLANAFRYVFDQGYQKAVVVGCDCYGMDADLVQRAFQKLDEYDISIGPTADGGYYLLGLNRLYETLFVDKDWSTDQVYHQTLRDIERLNLSHCRLPVLHDVDTAEDLAEYPDLMLIVQAIIGG